MRVGLSTIPVYSKNIDVLNDVCDFVVEGYIQLGGSPNMGVDLLKKANKAYGVIKIPKKIGKAAISLAQLGPTLSDPLSVGADSTELLLKTIEYSASAIRAVTATFEFVANENTHYLQKAVDAIPVDFIGTVGTIAYIARHAFGLHRTAKTLHQLETAPLSVKKEEILSATNKKIAGQWGKNNAVYAPIVQKAKTLATRRIYTHAASVFSGLSTASAIALGTLFPEYGALKVGLFALGSTVHLANALHERGLFAKLYSFLAGK